MPEPIYPGSNTGFALTGGGGFGWGGSAINDVSTVSGVPQEYYIMEQSMDVDYTRRPSMGVSIIPSSISLSATTDISFGGVTIWWTHLSVRIKASSSGRRILANFTGTYSQPQKFQVFANQTDIFGQSYGDLSSASGVLLGPRGSIRTVQPFYARYDWSSMSGLSALSGNYEETIDAYNIALDPQFFSGIASAGPPMGGWGFGDESKIHGNPMNIRIKGLAETQNKWYPQNNLPHIYHTPMWIMPTYGMVGGQYAASAEDFNYVYGMLDNIGKDIQKGIFTIGGKRFTPFLNTALYWDQGVQDQWGTMHGDYVIYAFSAPVMPHYDSLRHDYS